MSKPSNDPAARAEGAECVGRCVERLARWQACCVTGHSNTYEVLSVFAGAVAAAAAAVVLRFSFGIPVSGGTAASCGQPAHPSATFNDDIAAQQPMQADAKGLGNAPQDTAPCNHQA